MKNNRSNWQTLLNRWISGEADRNDERSLEAMAKDDPFLADALEGFRSLPETDHARSVTRMKANLRSKYERKQKGLVFYIQRAAAVGVLLLAAWFVLGQFDGNERANELADQQQVKENRVPADPAESILSDSSNIAFEEEPNTEDESQKENEVALVQDAISPVASKKNKAEEPPAAYSPSPKLLNEGATELAIVEEPEADMPPVQARSVPRTEDALGYIAEEEKISEQPSAPEKAYPTAPLKEVKDADRVAVFEQIIKGKVSDNYGSPLIGANVLIVGTEQGTVTDIDGNFILSSPIENPPLTISYTGFQNENVQANGSDFLLIYLDDNGEALSEVVVTGLSSRAKKSETAAPSFKPRGGFKKFEKYIKQNLLKPQQAVDAGIYGTVKIGFRLDESGKPIDLKVLQSLGFGCDEEAQRLLLEGPKWEGPANVQTVYSFDF